MERITVSEAARLLNIRPQLLRLGLQQNKFPFGMAVKSKKWIYIIYKEMLKKYVEPKAEQKINP